MREANVNQSAWRGVCTRIAELNQPVRVQKELEKVTFFGSKFQTLKHLRTRITDRGWKMKPPMIRFVEDQIIRSLKASRPKQGDS